MTRPTILRPLHLVLGLLTLAAFLATGLYMDRSLAHLAGMPDAPRNLYRSGHIYILFAALLHLMLGVYVTNREWRAARVLQYLGSSLLTVAAALFVYGFVVETPLGLVERPATRMGIELSLAGTVLHCLAAATFRVRRPGEAGQVTPITEPAARG